MDLLTTLRVADPTDPGKASSGVARMSEAICGRHVRLVPARCRAHASYLLDHRPDEVVILDFARYATNFL